MSIKAKVTRKLSSFKMKNSFIFIVIVLSFTTQTLQSATSEQLIIDFRVKSAKIVHESLNIIEDRDSSFLNNELYKSLEINDCSSSVKKYAIGYKELFTMRIDFCGSRHGRNISNIENSTEMSENAIINELSIAGENLKLCLNKVHYDVDEVYKRIEKLTEECKIFENSRVSLSQ